MKKYLFLILLFFNMNVYASDSVEVDFKKCVDGDTAVFLYNEDDLRVRFLAIDTPETVHPSKEKDPVGILASDYTCERISNAKKIKLEYDDNSYKTDKYDRHLAWIWIDDSLLQSELVELGFARVYYLYGDYKYTDELYLKEDLAKEDNFGIWAEDDYYHTVTFSFFDDEVTKVVRHNDLVDNYIPEVDGYEFIGWNYKNNEFDMNTRVDSDIVLVADFKRSFSVLDVILILFLLLLLYLSNKKSFYKFVKKEFKKIKR